VCSAWASCGTGAFAFNHASSSRRTRKSKRRDRIDTLLDSLDDDEVDALRRRLAADGQQVDLNTLLQG
jgi:hypothetical protein